MTTHARRKIISRAWIFIVLVLVLVLVTVGCAKGPAAIPQQARPVRCTPDLPCWPTNADWQQLAARLTGKLEQPVSPLAPCATDVTSEGCATAIANANNPFYLQDQAGGTQSLGWLDAWTAAPSRYAVAAESAGDIVEAVKFAREHHVNVVVKGTGHDYLGRSTAPDSLLVWTHKLRRITVHDAFVARGCPGTPVGIPAVTVEAGTRWLEAYQEVTVKHGRYVQGGGCTSVGAAGGFMQGGGFGSWSKKYGIAAAGMLEAEVVTADGTLRVANRCQNQDLFWALRGGGGGTFGVVTEVTLMTHALPSSFGFLFGSITATSDGAFQELLEHFLQFYGSTLNNEQWGEQAKISGNNSIQLALAFQGMTATEAEQIWQPFRAWIDQNRDRFTMQTQFAAFPGERMWNVQLFDQVPGSITKDQRPGQPAGQFWWATNQGEVATFWYAYQSRWVPANRFEGAQAKRFASSLFAASRHWPLELHFNKGQAGASAEALVRDRETSMNPAVYNAAALLIAAADGGGYPGVRGREPDPAKGDAVRARVSAAMKIIRDATPDAGSYVNETDYFEPDWQRGFWGDNYPKLLAIKHKYDPDGLFSCHHCVGSEGTSSVTPATTR